MNLISVIVPIYNTDEFLEESIQSVLDQTYEQFEVIMINDNSDDTSKEIMDTYTLMDDRIKAYHFSERRGVGAARNFGMDKASGTYVCFLDSDDFLPNNTLELLADNINEYKIISGRQRGSHLSEVTEEVEDNGLETEIDVYTEDKYKLIRNNSVLNRLFNSAYIKENNIRFSEKVDIYSDLAFIIPAFANVTEVPYLASCLYYKRRRNDPITNPSLMQIGMEGRIRDFTTMYISLKTTYTDESTSTFIDNQFLNFYRGPVVRFFNKNENVDDAFSGLVKGAKLVNTNVLKKRSFMIRREIKVLKKGTLAKFKRVNLWHHRVRKIKRALKGRKSLYIQLYRAVFLKMPIKKDLVVFESFLGKSYSDSPKYIYEYMLENKQDYTYVWIFNEKRDVPGNPIQAIRFSLKYYYYLARAKYWVNNVRMPLSLNKREENIYLQTWHGTPLKRLATDMEEVHMPGTNTGKYKRNFLRDTSKWDYLISPNAYSTEIFKRAFQFDKVMIESGYPRNDLLLNFNDKMMSEIKIKNKLPTNKKIILYAPTWRDNQFYERGKYKFDLQMDLERMKEALGEEYIIVLRLHYLIAENLDLTGYEGFVYDFSKYEDIAELYLISDILITDYSSVFFDFAHLKRPILFYTYDLEEYRDTLRGFYIDMEKEVPGPLLRDTEEIINAVVTINEVSKQYKDKYITFYNKFCQWDDGNAAEKTVEIVFKE